MSDVSQLTIFANWAQIISAGATAIAAGLAFWSAKNSARAVRISSIDTGFEIVYKLICETRTLWDKYAELKIIPVTESNDQNDERWAKIDAQMDKILDSAEWTCIYLKSRKNEQNYSLHQLEEEVLAPIERMLQPKSQTQAYMRAKIYGVKNNAYIYVSLVDFVERRAYAPKLTIGISDKTQISLYVEVKNSPTARTFGT